MAVKYRDYYETLGVPKNASQDDIKKAFKKLARKHHPDVAKDDPKAEETFKAINEAYEVLGDPEKRQKYDTLGPDWQQGAGFGGGGFPGSGAGGFDFNFGGSTGFSDFFESIFGRRGGSGGGGDPFGAFGGGAHRARSTRPIAGEDNEADLLVSIEEIMTGSSRQIRLSQPNADGSGSTEKTIRIKIPKGIAEGKRIRCAGLGNPGYNGGPAGDLYLRIRLERHPLFTVEGSDLMMELPLAPWEIVLGTTATLHTPHGDVKLTIKANSQSGKKLRLKGKGLPKGKSDYGDLYVTLSPEFPEESSSAEMELWKQLSEISTFRPRD